MRNAMREPRAGQGVVRTQAEEVAFHSVVGGHSVQLRDEGFELAVVLLQLGAGFAEEGDVLRGGGWLAGKLGGELCRLTRQLLEATHRSVEPAKSWGG